MIAFCLQLANSVFLCTDVSGRALLADFGLSRRLDVDKTCVSTDRAGTKYWEAAEIIEADSDCETPNQHIKYKMHMDIQVRLPSRLPTECLNVFVYTHLVFYVGILSISDKLARKLTFAETGQ